MTHAMVHRGPDDAGFLTVGEDGVPWLDAAETTPARVGLGHRRLSILDLTSSGHQPMVSADGRYWISYNGELYNYQELARTYGLDSLRGTSDTEVLLETFARRGEAALSDFNGIFAFALYDAKEKSLRLVRDPIGVKPLYWFEDARGVFFASEIRALLQAMPEKPRLRVPLLSQYLLSNWIPDPDTLFEGIYKLEPGHLLEIIDGKVEKRAYWDFTYAPDRSVSVGEWEARLDEALEAGIARQMRSDVPVAFFLSGGIDSSLLAAKAARLRGEPPTTYTIGFRWSESQSLDADVTAARRLARDFAFDYREIFVEPDIVSLLPKIVECLEEPVADPAAICSYLICREASREFKVLVSGQGGDELFGGYPVYRGGSWLRILQHVPPPLLKLLHDGIARLPYAVGGRRVQAVHRAKRLLASTSDRWPNPFFALRGAIARADLDPMLSREVAPLQLPPYFRQLEHFARARQWDALQQMMYLDAKTYLPSTNLTYTDKTGMAHSVEVRVPFLDMELVRLVGTIPSRYKASLRRSKILLKLLSRHVLPEAIIHRRKAGFGLPLRDWMLKDLQPMASDLLSTERLSREKLFDPSTPQRWLAEHRDCTADHSAKLYTLMAFQLWAERFGVKA